MNRILYVGRKAKGMTEAQMAKVLQIDERAYIEMEHSLSDVTAPQALKLAKLFDIDPEIFIYAEGKEVRLVKYAANEISNYLKDGLLDGMSPQSLFSITGIGNTTLTLAAQLNEAVYRQYELEKDNQALRKLNADLKALLQSSA
jgi:transcriptional regulator with XRE-family HTH domain